jgi:hypothetical protein
MTKLILPGEEFVGCDDEIIPYLISNHHLRRHMSKGRRGLAMPRFRRRAPLPETL